MTHIEKLDYVLKILYDDSKLIFSRDIHNKVTGNIEKDDLSRIINYLNEKNYIEKIIDESPNNSKIRPPFYIRITYGGVLFFEKGGFSNENKTLRLNHNWKIAKTIAATANAIIIILISIWAIIESRTEPKTEKLEKEIKLLKEKVEKMNFIENDSLKINNLN